MEQLSAKKLTEAIVNRTMALSKKKSLYEDLKRIENEVKAINESLGTVGSFGFKVDGDTSQKHKTGFENGEDMKPGFGNFQSVSELVKEMEGLEELENPLDVTNTQHEIETLQKIKTLEDQISKLRQTIQQK